jgi:hypothetical protein
MTEKQQKPPPKRKKKAKRLEIEAAAVSRGTELGRMQAHQKKEWTVSLKEHMGHWIDNIDPFELAAIGSGTIMIHGLIINSPELKNKALVWLPSILGVGGIMIGYGLSQLEEMGIFGRAEPLKDDWPYWIAAFFISYLLVRHGGQLLGLMREGAGSLTTVIGALLG